MSVSDRNLLDGFLLKWEWYKRRAQRWLIQRLGGYDQAAVGTLVYMSRRMAQEVESYDGRFVQVLNAKLKHSIARVDPELGRIYGYSNGE